ncbi:hypothetical protein G9A89_002322 [Geosiphon pyriformis]|nr:hypothetical protein G9A89_002322 [Geosiphon pyriformis]
MAYDTRSNARLRKGMMDNKKLFASQTSLAKLFSRYVGTCDQHPEGCYHIETHHLPLTNKMFRHWASLAASGDDVDERTLPNLSELPEFTFTHTNGCQN